MSLQRISFCYYPTTVILIDDSKEFLEKLEFNLARHFPLISYDSPQKVLKCFAEEYIPSSFIDRCITDSNEDSNSDHINQNVYIRNIHKEIYNPKRFSEITVAIVDYAMPNINGLELSQQLKQRYSHIKIILLTGEADQNLAVAAFNDGLIDKFIMKSTNNLSEIILKSIQELQNKYFNHLSEICFSKASHSKSTLNSLADPAFIQVFDRICQDNFTVEYYLMDNQGSFLLLDRLGKPGWFAVKTEHEMEQFYQYALLEQAPDAVVHHLKTRQRVVYFQTEEDLRVPPQYWEKYLHPAEKLIGKETYYYAYINQHDAYKLDFEKIVSYQQYLDKLD